MMKKLFAALLALMLILISALALASDDGSAYDAFATYASGVSSRACLDEIMNGAYAAVPKTAEEAALMAPKLEQISAVSTKDISVYAAENSLSEETVRRAYYAALSNVLDAELLLNPESEARYQDVKALLALHAESDANQAGSSAKSGSSSTKANISSSKSSSASSKRNTDTPDRNTYNTPDRNTYNTPDRNTYNTPDRNTPDRNTRNSPDRNT